MSISFKLEATGQSVEDIEDALEKALEMVRDGYTSGHMPGEDRQFNFELDEE